MDKKQTSIAYMDYSQLSGADRKQYLVYLKILTFTTCSLSRVPSFCSASRIIEKLSIKFKVLFFGL